MSLKHQTRRRDANQRRILAGLDSLGIAYEIIELPVDLLIGYGGGNHLIDIKAEAGGSKTVKQLRFAARWPSPVHFCTTVDEVLEAIGAQ